MIIGNKERKLNKNKAKLEKLQEYKKNRCKTLQTRTLQGAGSEDLNFIRTTGSRRMGLHPDEAI
jgi:hypothetical protein